MRRLVTWLGGGAWGQAPAVVVAGHAFQINRAVLVNDTALIEALSDNPNFKVEVYGDGDGTGDADVAAPGGGDGAVVEPAGDGGDADGGADGGGRAARRGRKPGRYARG
jgi:hypothetical protein